MDGGRPDLTADEWRSMRAHIAGRVISELCQEGLKEAMTKFVSQVSAKGLPVLTPSVTTLADGTGVDVVFRFRLEFPADDGPPAGESIDRTAGSR